MGASPSVFVCPCGRRVTVACGRCFTCVQHDSCSDTPSSLQFIENLRPPFFILPENAYLCPDKSITYTTMEKTINQEQNPEPRKQPLTREEIWRRMKANRQHKQEFVERAIKRMTEEYKARYGKEPAGFEVW